MQTRPIVPSSPLRRTARGLLRGALPALAIALLATLLTAPPAHAQGVRSAATAPFFNFESGPTHPLLLSPDGQRLYVLNTPDNRVEIYATDLDGRGTPHLRYLGAVFTGLDPVSMALDPDDPHTLFVANVISDTVSVVDLGTRSVVATIDVGDEPQDVLVADGKLFVATARSAAPLDLLNPGSFVDNAVVIASADAPWDILDRVEIPAHKPRALARAGDAVYVIPLNSGNHTTILSDLKADALGLGPLDLAPNDTPFIVNPALALPDLSAPPFVNTAVSPFLPIFGWELPQTSRVVMDDEFPGQTTVLADVDIVGIDIATHALLPPHTTGVGTTLFAIETNPLTGQLWVANTEALNRTRFEPAISGQAFDNRITVADAGGAVSGVNSLGTALTGAEHSQPATMAFYEAAADGAPSYAYVGTLGDATVLVLDAFSGAYVGEIPTGELPSGLAVDRENRLLFVFCRGDLSLRAYDIANHHVPVGRITRLAYDPEPKGLSVGRQHLYDARVSTGAGTGNFSCASCHVFGHADQLAWDLGNPEGGLGYFYPDLLTGEASFDGIKVATKKAMMTSPMKGPMTTQSLRGLGDLTSKPLHWRGDRRFFHMFRGAFQGLLGGSGITPASMQEYAGFVRSMAYAPNPFQPKDRVYTGAADDGKELYGMNDAKAGKVYNPNAPGISCISCHIGNFSDKTDFTGSQKTVNFDGEVQLFNTPQLRGIYEKDYAHLTGYGTAHDGVFDGIRGFMDISLPILGEGFPNLTTSERDEIADFVRAWDTGIAPLVGAQFTATPDTWADGLYDWLDLAEAQARPPADNIDLIGKAILNMPNGTVFRFGVRYGLLPDGVTWGYEVDVGGWVTRGPIVSAIAAGLVEMTFTAVPPGNGVRLGVDRDEDGLMDGVERAWGTSVSHPDTDRDTFADGLEVALGSNPTVFDAALPADTTEPTISADTALDVFTTTATLHFVTDEPAGALVELGTTPGGPYDLASFADGELLGVHDVILDGLPALTTVHYRITATDAAGNAATSTGEFDTAPPLYHVSDMSLDVAGTDPYTLTGTVTIVDQDGAPVDDAPVFVLWGGDVGGAGVLVNARTDPTGLATFVIGPYTPAGPTVVTMSPAHVGSGVTADAYFAGFGGDDPNFYYNQSFNAVNYATVSVP